MFARILAVFVVVVLTRMTWAAPPTIHVEWSDTGTPTSPDDYEIDATDPDFADVQLKTGSLTWQIWSTDSDNPNSIGDIGVISSPHAENFGVEIKDNSGNAGARVVKGIVLDPTNSSNYSNLTGGSISGNLEGDLLLQQSSGGTGGEVTGTFSLGGVSSSAEITIPVVKATFSVDGSLTCPLTISDEIDAAGLSIDGNVGSTGSITIVDMVGTNSQLTIGGNVAATPCCRPASRPGTRSVSAGFSPRTAR